MMKNKQQDDVT